MENIYAARLSTLRKLMQEKGVDYYMIPTADFHNSEYVHDYFKCRAFMSGFTGSNGTMVVSDKEACLWTDGRYFIQAEKEMEISADKAVLKELKHIQEAEVIENKKTGTKITKISARDIKKKRR